MKTGPSWVGLIAGAWLWTSPSAADSVATGRWKEIQRFVGSAARGTRTERYWTGGTSVALGGLAIGIGTTGIVRDGSVPAMLLTANGGFNVASGFYALVFQAQPSEELYAEMQRVRSLPPELAVPLVEREWARLAAAEHTRRQRFGVLRVVAGGALALGAGLAAWAPTSFLGGSEQDRTRSAAVLMGLALANTTTGLHDLLVQPPFEQAYEGYRLGNPPPSTQARVRVRFDGSGVHLRATF